ncbi:MAG: hypothetical protein RI897_1219 [Verrucomicrobiota bacterium]|jgi:hypothetical protein
MDYRHAAPRPVRFVRYTRVLSFLIAVGFFLGCGGYALAQPLRITEFMTIADQGIRDEDGEMQDWIELYNPGRSSVSLAGWHLTDDQTNPAKWTFPSGTLGPREFLVVLASGKDRTAPDGPWWHTNFKLDREGEYLALVPPTGFLPASEWYPAYPPQLPNSTYGVGMESSAQPIIGPVAAARLLSPLVDQGGLAWTESGFNDGRWSAVALPVGYEISGGGGGPDPDLVDVTLPENFIIPTSYNSPGGEEVEKAIDNNPATKYLNFDKVNAGFTLTPESATTVVRGLRFTSANDAPERDPTSFTLEGSQDGAVFSLIAQGNIPDFMDRFFTVEVGFSNDMAYRHYRLLFPTVRNAAGAVAMQIAEVELLGFSGPPPPAFPDIIQTDVSDLVYLQAASVYLRVPFNLEEGTPLDDVVLRMRYDDGFVAYLNGVPVASANAPLSPGYASAAMTDRPSAAAARAEDFAIPTAAQLLQPGMNMLAIHALNDQAVSPEFLLGAELLNAPVTLGASGFLTTPTPGSANPQASQGRVAEPVPSLARGFYPSSIEVQLTCATENASIVYTTDGSEPTAGSAVYSGPILITRSGPLRAMAIRDGWISSAPIAHTYLIRSEIIQQNAAAAADRGFPSTWGGVTADYDMDQTMVASRGLDLYGGVYANSIRNDLMSIPSIALSMEVDDLFGPLGIYSNPENRGDAWERPVSVELIDPANPENTFQADAGVRIQGAAFRRFDLTMKKSFRLVFRESYGPTWLEYPLFGPEAADRFNTVVLRANSNDAWPWGGGGALYIRDAFAMETARDMGMVSSHSAFMHLYLNGHYWGLYNPVERPDAAFSSTYHGGDRDAWDALNQDSVPDGNPDAWNRMLGVLAENMANNEVYYRIQGLNPDGTRNPDYEDLLDIDNLIDYMIMNLYIGNGDWPHRNFWVGRDREGLEGFQFYPWDSETALGMTGLQANRTGVTDGVARPYAAARSNSDFLMRFADRVHRHFSPGGALYVNPLQPAWDPASPENNPSAARFNRIATYVEGAIVGEAVRWGDQMNASPYTPLGNWQPTRNSLLQDFFPQRSAIVLDQFRAAGLYPRTDAPATSHPGGSVEAGYPLVLSVPKGTIYYTTDGSDPRQPVDVEVVSQDLLVGTNTVKRALVPSTTNGGSALGSSWYTGITGFNDSAWSTGNRGVGYDIQSDYLPYIGTSVYTSMFGINGSAFIRIPFNIGLSPLPEWNDLVLRARYDDGFIAYLNGVQVASANAPGAPAWNSVATQAHDDTVAVLLETFDLTDHLALLEPGENLLAVHALNLSTTSSDLLFDAELEARQTRIIGEEPAARVYTGPIAIDDLTTIRARTLDNGEWSALTEATFIVGNPRLVISELHYHPADPSGSELAAGFLDSDEFEFVELYNAGTGSLDLRGVRFVDGVEFSFPTTPLVSLKAGETLLLVSNPAAFELRYGPGLPVAGAYTGRFSNGGERVAIQDVDGKSLVAFGYSTLAPWPMTPDGLGPSLTLINANADPSDPASWVASSVWGGTPSLVGTLAAPHIQGVVRSESSVTLQLKVQPGKTYSVQGTTDLEAGWEVVENLPAATSDSIEISIPWSSDTPAAFYRVVELP